MVCIVDSEGVVGKVLSRYHYRFRSRHLGALWAIIYLIVPVSMEVYISMSSAPDNARGHLIYLVWWGVWGILIMAALYAEKRFTTLLQPVTLTDDGIIANTQPLVFKFWPKHNLALMRWNEIERIELIRWPHVDVDSSTFKPSALRIVAGNRKIVIHKKITGYDELSSIVEEQMRRHGKPLRVTPRNAQFE